MRRSQMVLIDGTIVFRDSTADDGTARLQQRRDSLVIGMPCALGTTSLRLPVFEMAGSTVTRLAACPGDGALDAALPDWLEF